MLSLALALLILAAQPDDTPVSTRQVVPPPSADAIEEARRKIAEEEAQKEAQWRADLARWRANHPAPPPAPLAPTEEERRAAANRAALERAEQASRDAAAPPGAWPDDGKMRCKTTENGFVCGNSEEALGPDSPARKALEEVIKPN